MFAHVRFNTEVLFPSWPTETEKVGTGEEKVIILQEDTTDTILRGTAMEIISPSSYLDRNTTI